MSDQDWQKDHARSFGVFLNGDALREVDDHGTPIRDDSFLLLFNAHHDGVSFTLPSDSFGAAWVAISDTAGALDGDGRAVPAGGTLAVAARSLVVLSRHPTPGV